MQALRNLPIGPKLTLVIMATCVSVLILTDVALFIFQSATARSQRIDEMSSLAQIAAHNSAAAAAFSDRDAAVQILSALETRDDVEGACLLLANGEHAVAFDRDHEHDAAGEGLVSQGRRDAKEDLLFASAVMLDGMQVGTLFLRADFARAQMALLKLYAKTWLLVLGVALLVALVLAKRLQPLITDPILRLAQFVRGVGEKGDYSVHAVVTGNDEIGALTDAFNKMLDQIRSRDGALLEARDRLEERVEERTRELEAIHRQLVEALRRGGMAEIASNVLHNVGNVLNSVNVSASVVSDNLKKSKTASLGKVAALMQQHEADLPTFFADDPRGKQLPAYVASLSDHLMAGQQAALSEMEQLQGNIDHIKEIVSMQQNYAKVSGLTEVVEISALVEDSLRMNLGALSRHGVELKREYEDVPMMEVEKHKILQILVNLIRNAKYACDETNEPDKRITVRIARHDKHIGISVIDNGVGIPAENLTRIFNHGFTTRESGHGFGLHSGALAAKEMGGFLEVHSAGPGCGATFTLGLPIPAAELTCAA
ncbi:MAG TPA: ATP-binding protein [Chthoniobacterales bacterium]|nr:ATP-binding protein [Chthoniobacterales bacterium]